MVIVCWNVSLKQEENIVSLMVNIHVIINYLSL